jgi:hypothetical protein
MPCDRIETPFRKTGDMSDFPGVAFQSLLTVEAILLGIFGFLYSTYAMYVSSREPTDLPPIAPLLRRFCKLISFTIGFVAAVALFALYQMQVTGGGHVALAWAVVVIVTGIATLTIWWAFWIVE